MQGRPTQVDLLAKLTSSGAWEGLGVEQEARRDAGQEAEQQEAQVAGYSAGGEAGREARQQAEKQTKPRRKRKKVERRMRHQKACPDETVIVVSRWAGGTAV
ncbi:hypothetical protein E2C01_034424 [Portunus trituberculatus]|uniref:Uncharacterized protein n=1 Tax=Portunus trituberculatus TaxID=210409 RepID=A0A5B7F1K2_PORTR|nr:hypothetical protein [Portunus trituberculatus]